MTATLTPQQIDDILRRHFYGHLACHNGDELYLVPITYAYAEGNLYAYTREGKKVDMLRNDPHCCVQVEELHRDGSWESVIVWGEFSELHDRADAQKAMVLLADTFARFDSAEHPMVSPLIRDISAVEWENNAPVMYKIMIEKSTGRSQTYE